MTALKVDGLPVHPSIDLDAVLEMIERRMTSLDDPGVCLGCGLENGPVEPDARRYPCEGCGAPLVYAAEEILLEVAP